MEKNIQSCHGKCNERKKERKKDRKIKRKIEKWGRVVHLVCQSKILFILFSLYTKNYTFLFALLCPPVCKPEAVG